MDCTDRARGKEKLCQRYIIAILMKCALTGSRLKAALAWVRSFWLKPVISAAALFMLLLSLKVRLEAFLGRQFSLIIVYTLPASILYAHILYAAAAKLGWAQL